MELFLNGKSLGRRKKELVSRLVWENVSFEKGILEAVGFDENGRETLRTRNITPGNADSIAVKIDIEKRENHKGFYAFIEVFMTDENKTVLETAEDELTFDICNGTLIGVDNGDSCSLLPFKRNYVKLHRGHAMITAVFEENGKIRLSNGALNAEYMITSC